MNKVVPTVPHCCHVAFLEADQPGGFFEWTNETAFPSIELLEIFLKITHPFLLVPLMKENLHKKKKKKSNGMSQLQLMFFPLKIK